MWVIKRYFLFFAIAFACAIICVNLFDFSLQLCSVLIAISAIVAICATVFKYPKQGIAIVLGVCVAILWFYAYLKIDKAPHYKGDKFSFVAVAKDFSYENSQKTGVVCDVKVKVLNDKDVRLDTRLYFRDKTLTLYPGDTVSGECSLETPVNDEDFNAFTYYKTRGIDAIGFCNEQVEVIKKDEFDVKYLPKIISNYVSEKIKTLLPPREAGLVNAILIGDKTDFLIEDQDNFSTSGLAHVVAVSGMHLAFLASFIFMIFGRRKAFIVAIPILILFTLVVGAPPSVIRALIMHILVIVATLMRREADSVTSLSFAMVLILVLNPYTILDIGFQLSFTATLGLILYSGKLNAFFLSHIKVKNKLIFKIVNFFTSTLSATLSATLFTTPIIIWNFRTVSLVAPISNLLLLWLVTVIFIGAIIGVCVSAISISVGKILMYPISLLSSVLILSVDFLADLSFAEVFIDSVYSVLFAIYLYVIIILLLSFKNKNYLFPIICTVVIFCITIVLNHLSITNTKGNGIRFSVLDMGQGASMVADINDTCVVVDCGGNRSVNAGNITSEYVDKIRCDDIDSLILTHMHSDHVNGAKRFIEQNDVLDLYVPAEAEKDEAYKNIAESAIRRGTKIHFVSEGVHLNSNGMECIIYPTSWSESENEQGLVVIFKKDDFELIVTGDLEQKSEEMLCEKYELFDTEVYIVGHHGSDTSSSLKFMNRILPEFAIISVGKDNYYRHPHNSTLYLFEKMGIYVRRTDIDGDIVFYSDDIIKGGN